MKKKVHVSGTEEESVSVFLVKCRWEIFGGLVDTLMGHPTSLPSTLLRRA